jgi:hypothetical protein
LSSVKDPKLVCDAYISDPELQAGDGFEYQDDAQSGEHLAAARAIGKSISLQDHGLLPKMVH